MMANWPSFLYYLFMENESLGFQSDGSYFMMPFAIGATALLGGLAILELSSRGRWASPDNSADLYSAIMVAYAGAGELRRWLRKPGDALPVEDPKLERARKGGVFVGFWLLLYAAAVILRVWDPSIPMPHELKAITLRIVGIFFVTYSSRRVQKARHPPGPRWSAALRAGPARAAAAFGDDASFFSMDDEDPEKQASDTDAVMDLFATAPDGLTRRELGDRLPHMPARTLNRALHRLLAARTLTRDGHPKSPNARYRLT